MTQDNHDIRSLRELAEGWLSVGGDAGMQQASEWCSLDLIEALDALKVCDCTSGREHVHVGEGDDL